MFDINFNIHLNLLSFNYILLFNFLSDVDINQF